MKTKIDNYSSLKTQPFLGHVGVGSRLRFIRNPDRSIISETILGQLWILAMLALVSFYPPWLLIFQAEKINGGWVGKLLLLLPVLFIGPFFYKSVIRFASKRRIELRRIESRLYFFESKTAQNKEILFKDIHTFKKESHSSFVGEDKTSHFSIIVIDSSGVEHCLCTSDQEKNIDYIFEQIKTDLPDKFLI